MYIGLSNGARTPASPQLHQLTVCQCQECGKPIVARCGEQKVWHWAHAQNSNCPAGKGETAWHLHWKSLVNPWETECYDLFTGHRPDICLDLQNDYLVVELQHSPIDAVTIRERERAYNLNGSNLVWVVDVSHRNFKLNRSMTTFVWKNASQVWNEATNVVFDTGTHWVWYDINGYPSSSGFTANNIDRNPVTRLNNTMSHGKCMVFNRPICRSTMSYILLTGLLQNQQQRESFEKYQAAQKPKQYIIKKTAEQNRNKTTVKRDFDYTVIEKGISSRSGYSYEYVEVVRL